MKTDRYKDWESKFFAGEELTPEEELFLKNESDNPYFSFLKEEKQEKLDISFEDFLQKTEEPKIVPVSLKKSNFKIYWMAASLVLLMGISVLWIFNKTEKITPIIVKNEIPKTENHSEKNIIPENPVLANRENQKPEIKIQPGKSERRQETYFAQQKSEKLKIHISDENYEKPSSDYNPNYVIVNGKPIYNEQEAIAVTEDAFNYFASNVTQTINQAENAQNVSKDLYQIINF